jgi:hypothetical protein
MGLLANAALMPVYLTVCGGLVGILLTVAFQSLTATLQRKGE